MKKYLLLCVEIEETAARSYRQLATSTKLPHELRVILQNLADDEDTHAMQLRFALRFPAGSAIVDKKFDPTPAQQLLQRAKELLNSVSQQECDSRQAIEIGVELEQDFCQAHLGNSVEFKDENLKKMFAALAQDDRIHRQKLLDAKARFL